MHDTHVQANTTLQPQPQLQKAQQILAGRELAWEHRERTWQLKRVAEERHTDLQVPSSFDRGAGLRNAPQK